MGESGHGNAVYRARQSVGERVLRKLQWETERCMPERRDLHSLKEAQIVIEKWRVQYNTKRPPSAENRLDICSAPTGEDERTRDSPSRDSSHQYL
jgi:hypothetical protein